MAMWRSTDALEAQLLGLAITGCSFADMCEVIAQHTKDAATTPARAAELLRGWVESGLLQDT
jgi:hypothetical protein